MFELQNRIDQLEIPDYRQFDPSSQQAQINQLATAQPMDTSQFLTAADLPTYDTTAFEKDIAELREQLNSNTAFNTTAGLTTPTFQGILPDFGGFNVR